MEKKNVIIIGGGLSGLSKGIYELEKGNIVKIFEKNKNAGGACSGWFKESYYIDNCMHWLTGTLYHTKTFKLWKRLGAFDETSELYQASYFYKSIYKNDSISLYSNIEKTRLDMICLSPNDNIEINRFIDCVKSLTKYNQESNIFIKGMNIMKIGIHNYYYYHKLSLYDLSLKFKHPLLKRLFTDYIPPIYSSIALIVSYATFASGNGKIYRDGSLVFANNILKRFLSLGGEIYFNSDVNKINLENKSFKNILVNNKEIYAGDKCIITCSPYFTFKNLLPFEYLPKALESKIHDPVVYPIISSFHVAYLITKDNVGFKDTVIIETKGLLVGTSNIERLVLKEYSYLENNKKEHVIQVIIPQYEIDYMYWNTMYKNDKIQYENIKKNISENIMQLIIDYFELNNKIKVLDIWTPLTYSMYLNAYKGSYMGFGFTNKSSMNKIPSKVKGLNNIYISTIWQYYTGGLPIAIKQ